MKQMRPLLPNGEVSPPYLRSVVRVRAKRVIGNTRTVDDRYYLSSLKGEAKQMLAAIRSHWQIENGLHWGLDIAFREDDGRVRKDPGAQNLATLRHIALNLLKQERMAKIGIRNKRLKAGWSEGYLLRALAGLFHKDAIALSIRKPILAPDKFLWLAMEAICRASMKDLTVSFCQACSIAQHTIIPMQYTARSGSITVLTSSAWGLHIHDAS